MVTTRGPEITLQDTCNNAVADLGGSYGTPILASGVIESYVNLTLSKTQHCKTHFLITILFHNPATSLKRLSLIT